ncbi:MAG: hypothetical protein ACOYL8_01195 [Patescibacteria group bacterium]
MKKMIKKNGSGAATLLTLGAGLAGLAASAYFFLSAKGKENQKYAKAWAIKMKGDVVEKLEAARDVTEPIYHEIIDSVAAKHEKIMKLNSKEVNELAQELKKHWKTLNGAVKNKKVNKKVAKKVVGKKVVGKK